MSKFYNKTAMGGNEDAFQTTRWSEIGEAQADDEKLQGEIIGNLLRRYWKPVYCHLRRNGYDNESAKDLTQGFFHEIVLGRELIQQTNRTKGRFRTFLLTALDRYVTDVRRKETAIKRSPAGKMAMLDVAELSEIPETGAAGPEQVFAYAWASDLLDDVLTKVKDGCYSTGKAVHWEVFRAGVLGPIFDADATTPITRICKKYGIDNEAKVSNMIVTVKRRFHTVLKQSLRRYVQSDAEVEEEFSELMKILSESSAR